jgi:hypothetical protein
MPVITLISDSCPEKWEIGRKKLSKTVSEKFTFWERMLLDYSVEKDKGRFN